MMRDQIASALRFWARRMFLVACLFLLAARALTAETVQESVDGVAQGMNARVGLYLRDTQDGSEIAINADARFPLNSTFKLFACAALLERVERGDSLLDALADLRSREVVPYSPAVKRALRDGAAYTPFVRLCAMMLSVSDNTAANHVLEEIGGPQGLTAFMRSIGDDVTRLDRWETELNQGLPGDLRDTTTPRALAHSLEKVLLGDVLSERSLISLQGWLDMHVVADDLFRAVLPADWRIYDRTGAGGNGSRSIIAVLMPPDRAPLIASVFITGVKATLAERNAAIARIGRAIVASVEGNAD